MTPAPDLLPARRPAVMGVLNVTPDSFSDGGAHARLDAALSHARRMSADGADIIDIGGESTRPGADPVGEQEEQDRVLPVIEALAKEGVTPLSIDTMKPAVAVEAVKAGASIWNDVSALTHSDDSLDAAIGLNVTIALMHMRGRPQTMQTDLAPYQDVTGEVASFLYERASALAAAGLDRAKIWLDPGIGFGKSLEDNLRLTRELGQLCAWGFPVLYGASRKSFIGRIDDDASEPTARLGGSLAAALFAVKEGARIVRVHDVRETVQALSVWRAVREAAG